MQADRHESICRIIDKSLAGEASTVEQQTLREHLSGCGACGEYLESCNRVLGGFQGFRFEADSGMNNKVYAAIALRAQQLRARQANRKRLWWSCLLAFVLTAAGSIAASRMADVVSGVFHWAPAQVEFGLIVFWIAPSLCLSLLFLLLPASSAAWANRNWTNGKGFTL